MAHKHRTVLWVGLAMVVIRLVLGTQNCTDNDVQLSAMHMDYTNMSAGRLEVCRFSEWNTICNEGWNLPDSRVACRHLDYYSGYQILVIGHGFDPETKPKIGRLFKCNGEETNITSCEYTPLDRGTSECPVSTDVWLLCNERCTTGNIRLVGTQYASQGNVEFCHEREWWPVCEGDNTGLEEYDVACRTLGYFSGYHNTTADKSTKTSFVRVIREDFLRISLNFIIDCNGTESTLEHCFQQGTFSYHCSGSNKQLHLVCIEAAEAHNCSRGDIRLVGGRSTSEGRLEVCYNHLWGTVCDEGWDNTAAKVVCQQLGFEEAASSIDYDIGQGSGPIFMTNVRCRSTSNNFSRCLFDDNHNSLFNCNHDNDVHLTCKSKDFNLAIPLAITAIVIATTIAISLLAITIIFALRKKRRDSQQSSTVATTNEYDAGNHDMHTYDYIDNIDIRSHAALGSLHGGEKELPEVCRDNHHYATLEPNETNDTTKSYNSDELTVANE